jgi:hypothetical protein
MVKKYSKKSMATIYMMLGILLLVIISTTVVINMKSRSGRSAEFATQDIPKEFLPIKTFVTSCTKSISEEAIVKIGANGGYINPLDPKLTEKAFIVNELNPTDGDILSLSENNKLPFWYQMETPNDCKTCSVTNKNTPLPEEIEKQISRYVELNIDSCLNDFKEFEAQQISVQKLDIPRVETLIGIEEITILLKYPLKAKRGDKQFELNLFNTKHAIAFPIIYNFALTIRDTETTNRYLEKIVINLISLYSGIDAKLPPFSASRMGIIKQRWLKKDVKDNIQQLISSFVPLIRIQNTKNGQKIMPEDVSTRYIYDFLFLENDFDFSKFEVRYHYLGWPIYMHIRPDSGGPYILPTVYKKPNPMGLFHDETINKYNFFYDVAFPIVVEIYDKDAWDGKGYTFFIALEANIKANKDILDYFSYGPVIGWNAEEAISVNPPEFESSVPLPSTEGEITGDSNGNLEGETVEVKLKINPTFKNFMCDEEQKIGTEVSLSIIDQMTQEPIPNVEIIYQCGSFSNCALGVTDGDGKFRTKLPICMGGALKLAHEEYYSTPILVDSLKEKAEEPLAPIELSKPYKKKVIVKALPAKKLKPHIHENKEDNIIRDVKENSTILPSTVDDNSQIFVMLHRFKESPYEKEYMIYLNVSVIEGIPIQNDIELIPGEYMVTITYVDNDPHTAKGKEICTQYCGWPWEKTKWVPETEINSTLLGFTEIKKENILWEVNENELADESKDVIVFYVISNDFPEYTTDLEKNSKIFEYSGLEYFRHFIQPDFSSYSQELAIP